MRLTPELMLTAYGQGIFPMAEGRHSDEVFWVSPERRGVFPVGGLHISRSLARSLRSGRFTASADRAFDAVVAGCADREETWINPDIAAVYAALHLQGAAHSVEVWQGEDLVGGIFGIVRGAAFFGESMFSRVTDASKVALAVLQARLVTGGFRLFDTQFLTPHLASLGAVEIPRTAYLRQLAQALRHDARFYSAGASSAGSIVSTGSAALSSGIAQRSAQTS